MLPPPAPVRQATLVAHYGAKPDDVARLLTDCQREVADALGSRFRRYELEQIHATFVGLERVAADGCVNRNLLEARGIAADMDFSCVLACLRETPALPLTVQIGGFPDRDCSFTSRGRRPHERSFSLPGGNVVVMGWPCADGGVYPSALQEARKSLQRCNVLHAYHRRPDDVDNDFFLRLGVIDEPDSVSRTERAALTRRVRSWLAARPPLLLTVAPADLRVAVYESEELPRATTRSIPLTDPSLTASALRRMLCP